MSLVKNPIALMSTFLWVGFVCAISFMEAWLKFKAPGITIPLGLGIGRLVFGALNKVEWVFALAILISGIMGRENWLKLLNLAYFIPLLILLLQTFWLLPALDARAEIIIHIHDLKPSNHHLYYVIMEVIKVFTLTLFGILHFKTLKS
ncbi:hypothetical protein [Algoriphagus sp.]|uniref:hypothetical protein n=1 Tax=Algoriphagus sp. TaxID=1872435 RepID=UPI003295D7E5